VPGEEAPLGGADRVEVDAVDRAADLASGGRSAVSDAPIATPLGGIGWPRGGDAAEGSSIAADGTCSPADIFWSVLVSSRELFSTCGRSSSIVKSVDSDPG
jgi:hypothetical protein